MKISLNWLKKYVEIPVSDEELVRLIGARLVEVEGVIDETHKYDNIYIVRVESCEKIPDTHLACCQINVGMAPFRGLSEVTTENEGASPVTTGASDPSRERSHTTLIQVVCGAPNVHAGMLAVWIAPGAVVPASVHEDAPFVIGKRKMRGYESCGMLAGADELDFGDDHTGIVEIESEMAQPGDKLADIFELNDWILDIENKSLTHRPDCFGMIGFAREVAGILGQEFDEEGVATEFWRRGVRSAAARGVAPAARGFRTAGRAPERNSVDRTPSIKIASPEICQRYSAITMEKHGEIEKRYLTWMDTILSKSGMKPISPIVDATNYLMLLTGQPLHAFDYDKFVAVGKTDKPEIRVRLARKGEKLVLLDDTEVVLNENDIVICSGEVPVALAGAMGGKSTMIDENTRNIIIESATFSLYNLRKTQMAHGVFSEAITRFTKGQPPYQTLVVAEACAEMLDSGFRVTAVGDEYPKPEKNIVVKITTDEINHLLGTNYGKDLIAKNLANVGFRITFAEDRSEVTTEKEGARTLGGGASDPCPRQMVIESPLWRTDIHIKEDIIEEVGRLLGYDNIEPTLPLHATAGINKMWELKKQLRDLLARLGANEVLTYSFVSERLLKKVGQDAKNSYKIVNSISPELQYVRQSLVPNLLEKTYLNEKLPVERFAIFEMNKVYQKKWGLDKEKVSVEKMQLGLVVAERKNAETAFYKAKKYVDEVLKYLGVEVEYVPLKSSDAEYKMFEPKRTAEIRVGTEFLGVVGEFKNSVKHEFKLADYLAGFEINLDLLVKKASFARKVRMKGSKKEDLTITTDKTYGEIWQELKAKYPDVEITPGVIYQGVKQKTKNMTFHLEY